jgi:hypothetical protein
VRPRLGHVVVPQPRPTDRGPGKRLLDYLFGLVEVAGDRQELAEEPPDPAGVGRAGAVLPPAGGRPDGWPGCAGQSGPGRARWPGAPPDRRGRRRVRHRRRAAAARAAPAGGRAAARAVTIRASQLPGGVRPSLDDAGPGGVQHPQGLPVPARARVVRWSRARASRPARTLSNTSLLAPWRPRSGLGRSTSTTRAPWSTSNRVSPAPEQPVPPAPTPPPRRLGQPEQPGMAGLAAWHLEGGRSPPLGSSRAAAWRWRWVSPR